MTQGLRGPRGVASEKKQPTSREIIQSSFCSETKSCEERKKEEKKESQRVLLKALPKV